MKNQEYVSWASEVLKNNVQSIPVRSGQNTSVFKLKFADQSCFLKIDKSLRKERDRLEWLKNKIPVPKVLAFLEDESTNAILLTNISGVDLADLSGIWPAHEVAVKLAQVLKSFHAIDAADCTYEAYLPGNTLVHGDACLPNFIFEENGVLSGYIDLGDMGVGNIDVDLSAAIWSLQYNLGKGYGVSFLKAYGAQDCSEKEVDRLRLIYESGPIMNNNF